MADHLLDRVGADDVCPLGLVVEEIVHLGDGAVVGHDRVAVVVHVEDQVLAHDGQADECDVSLGFHCWGAGLAVELQALVVGQQGV